MSDNDTLEQLKDKKVTLSVKNIIAILVFLIPATVTVLNFKRSVDNVDRLSLAADSIQNRVIRLDQEMKDVDVHIGTLREDVRTLFITRGMRDENK